MKNITTFNEILYLNQSNFTIFKSNNDNHFINNFIIDKFINFPYQFIRSIIFAIRQEYSQTYTKEIEDNNNIWLLLMNIVGFFFSRYSIGCILVAFLLNKFILSTSFLTAENTNNHSINRRSFKLNLLPNWIKMLLHSLTITLLIIWGCLLPYITTKDENSFLHALRFNDTLFMRFLLFILSYCIETIVSIANNQLPLDSSDFSIFELSLQYYWLSMTYKQNLNELNSWDFPYMPDFILTMASRIVIHLVELFKLRKFRLLGSISINFVYLGYMGHIIINNGLNAIPIITKFKNLPKVFFLFISISSLVCYFIAILLRLGNRNDMDYGIDKLQFYSFINNINHHLNLSGEEDFTMAISKFATLVSSNCESKNLNYNRELQSIKVPFHINRKLDLDVNNDGAGSTIDFSSNNSNRSNNFDLIHLLSQPDHNHISDTYDNENTFIIEDMDNNSDAGETTVENKIDYMEFWYNIRSIRTFLNIFKNFVKFVTNLITFKWLLNSRNDNEFIDEFEMKTITTKELLNNPIGSPIDKIDRQDQNNTIFICDIVDLDGDENEDNDPEYILESDIDIQSEINEDDANEDFEIQDMNNDNVYTLDDNIFNLINDNEFMENRDQNNLTKEWQFDILPILNFHMLENKRLTRRQYDNLISVTQKKRSKSQLQQHDIDTLCAVCKTNERNIVLWPCKCFALCETCRISLALRDYKTCICCRRNVEGFSKVYT